MERSWLKEVCADQCRLTTGDSFAAGAGMWDAKFVRMNIPNVLLTVMTVLVSAAALGFLYGEYKPALHEFRTKAQPLMQTGDSSLSRKSVNWLAATALSAALFICFVLV